MKIRALAALLLLVGCSSPIPNRDPVGERFPTVEGEALNGTPFTLPDDLVGQPAVLLIGYVQRTQFDIDRWLFGLLQAEVAVPIYEVPTIKSLVATQLKGTIDDGMRAGIPEEDWSSVVTVYGDAGAIVDLTGNERPQNTRVVVLDADGRVAWFHDRGYSARLALEVRGLTDDLSVASPPEPAREAGAGE
ncbi:MAG: hypothetical protein AAFZ65_04975 [Planctomycetota bacterium]